MAAGAGFARGAPLLLRPPPDLDPWLSAGIGVAFGAGDGAGDGDLQCHFPAMLGSGLVVVLEGSLGLHDGTRIHPLPAAIVSGPAQLPVTLHRTPRLRCIGVMVRPAAAAALLGDSPALLAGGMADAHDVFGRCWPGWMDRIAAERDDAARIVRLFDAVRQAIRRCARPDRRDAALQLQQAALQGLPAAARLTGWSTRHFERRFAAGFGLRPKLFQRLARTEAALRDMLASGHADAALALRHGYFDQSHMGRDFRAFAGASPGALLAAVRSGRPTAHWPLQVGAGYRHAGLRADFPGPASLFS